MPAALSRSASFSRMLVEFRNLTFDSAGNLVGTASEVSVHGSRLVVRGLRASGRTVRNNPRASFSIVALIFVALSGMKWAASRKAPT